jgi:hypothetical protein
MKLIYRLNIKPNFWSKLKNAQTRWTANHRFLQRNVLLFAINNTITGPNVEDGSSIVPILDSPGA